MPDGGIETGDLGGEPLVAPDVDGSVDAVAEARDGVGFDFDSHGENLGEATDRRPVPASVFAGGPTVSRVT